MEELYYPLALKLKGGTLLVAFSEPRLAGKPGFKEAPYKAR